LLVPDVECNLHEDSYGFSGLRAFSGNARNVVTNLAKKLLRALAD
jgi:hypothetical protein